MAVLVEAISVVVRLGALDRCAGGLPAFYSSVPNQTLCSDGELVRIGFMHPADVQAYVAALEGLGLRYLADDHAQDLVVVDQLHGLAVNCDWAAFGHRDIPGGHRVAACWLKNSLTDRLAVPEGWDWRKSLSSSCGFVASDAEGSFTKVARRDGVEEYASPLTDEPLFVGRTTGCSTGVSPESDPEPTEREAKYIETAWELLEKITAAMGPEQEFELIKVKTTLWGQVREARQSQHSILIAEGLALSRIRDGIRKKLEVGEETNQFYRAHQDQGRAEAYVFGQKLVRWNRLMERRLIDRLFARRGPLQPEKLLVILDEADRAFGQWRARTA